MKWFRNLKISYKIIFSFLIVVILSNVIIGVAGIVNILNITSLSQTIYSGNLVPLKPVYDTESNFLAIKVALRDMALNKVADQATYENKINTLTTYIKSDMALYAKNISSTKENDNYKILQSNITKYIYVTNQVVSILKLGNGDEDAKNNAIEILNGNATTIARDVDFCITNAFDINIKQAAERNTAQQSAQTTAIILMVIIAIVAIIITTLIGILVSKIISSPISKIVKLADSIAEGDLNISLNINTKDEVGMLAISIDKIVNSLKLLISDANMLSLAAVQGKLDIRADATKHKGDYKLIIEGVNSTLDAVVDKVYWYESLLDSIPFVISVTDMNLNWTFINKVVEKVLNVKRNDVLGHPCCEYNSPLCNTENCSVKRLNQGKTTTLTNMFGMDFKTETRFLRNLKGEDIGHIEIAQDITAQLKVSEYLNVEVERIAENLIKLSKGNIDLDFDVSEGNKYTTQEHEFFIKINSNLENVQGAMNALVFDANMLSNAAIEGKLSIRADASRHQGEFRNIIEGVNNTLNAVINPVKEAAAVLSEMAKGNLKVKVIGDYQGDHAEITNALNQTIDNISSYIGEISEVLAQLADRNLEVEITADYKGDFIRIKDSLNDIINSFNIVMRDMTESSEQVAASSKQVSDASQSLSQGASEQASAIEELSASIAEVAAQTRQVASNAAQANEYAISAKNDATSGTEQMKDMIKSMEEINESSLKVSKVIKVIDEIAFQTNMLALNAAVEAARAGQHGKGFAVVAEEVRNLASRSATAVKETSEMIENSLKRAKIGAKIANETATALEKIVTSVDKAASLVSEIASSSNEQATGIAQINRGIEQVAQVVQTNSATAEESAASSEELSGQAQSLKDMVSKFILKENEDMLEISDYNSEVSSQELHAQAAATKSPHKISLNEDDFGKY
jgi:methyl-accepting chemotaxis protein